MNARNASERVAALPVKAPDYEDTELGEILEDYGPPRSLTGRPKWEAPRAAQVRNRPRVALHGALAGLSRFAHRRVRDSLLESS